MPLQATSGAASYDAFGGGVPVIFNYIEDVFSTYLYQADGSSTQTINNGIDLSGKGGLVWIKSRSNATGNVLVDTVRGSPNVIQSNTTNAQASWTNEFGSFSSTGFTVPYNTIYGETNFQTRTYTSWTFREQPKFFDVQTFTYPLSGSITVPHNLASTPGCVMVKVTDGADGWYVYHRMANNGTNPSNYILQLNTTGAQINNFASWITVGSSSITFPSGALNPGSNFVMYLFAHDAGGFGLTGTDNVISCGSYTGDTSSFTPITLGYEPQWLMIKRSDGVGNWVILDTTRGMPTFDSTGAAYGQILRPNLALQETTGNATPYPVSTGFGQHYADGDFTTGNFIYIAIRRGPMKVPTSGTSVFAATGHNGTGATNNGISFDPVPYADLTWIKSRNTAGTKWAWTDRLRGATLELDSSASTAETTYSNDVTGFDFMSASGQSIRLGSGASGNVNTSGRTYSDVCFKRAPSVFDEVCYTGTGAIRTINHNLTVAPEWIIVKKRSASTSWYVYVASLGASKEMILDLTLAEQSDGADLWNSTNPTSSVFTLGADATVNQSTATYVAYLFATCAGVSKCGSYTGTGTTQTINCGFTGGARFVLIKRTDSTGDWYVWDNARGIISSNDPYLLLNSTAAEVTNTDYIDPASTGFQISSTAPAEINANGGSFIFLAIA